MSDLRLVADVNPDADFLRAVVLSGATKESAEPRLAKVSRLGEFEALNLPSGPTTLTRSIMRSGILLSSGTDPTILTIPTFTALNWARDPGNPRELYFLAQRGGDGQLFVNGGAGVTLDVTDENDIQYLPKNTLVLYKTYGVNLWHIVS